VALGYQKAPQMSEPRQQRAILANRPSDIWIPYPLGPTPNDAHIDCVFEGLCDLCIIYEEVGHFLQAVRVDKPPPLEVEHSVRTFHKRLLRWQQTLSDCVAIDRNSLPHAIAIQ
jgi:hypothetical protein